MPEILGAYFREGLFWGRGGLLSEFYGIYITLAVSLPFILTTAGVGFKKTDGS